MAFAERGCQLERSRFEEKHTHKLAIKVASGFCSIEINWKSHKQTKDFDKKSRPSCVLNGRQFK